MCKWNAALDSIPSLVPLNHIISTSLNCSIIYKATKVTKLVCMFSHIKSKIVPSGHQYGPGPAKAMSLIDVKCQLCC